MDDDDELFWLEAAEKLQDQLDGITSAHSTLSQAAVAGTDSPKLNNVAQPQAGRGQQQQQQQQQQQKQQHPAQHHRQLHHPRASAPLHAGDHHGPRSSGPSTTSAADRPHWQPTPHAASSLPQGRVSMAAKQAAAERPQSGVNGSGRMGGLPAGPSTAEVEQQLAQERGSNSLLRDKLQALEKMNYDLQKELNNFKQSQEPNRPQGDSFTIADLNSQIKKLKEQQAHMELEVEDVRRAGGERDQRLQQELRTGKKLAEENKRLLQLNESLKLELDEVLRDRRDRAAGILSQQPSVAPKLPSTAGGGRPFLCLVVSGAGVDRMTRGRLGEEGGPFLSPPSGTTATRGPSSQAAPPPSVTPAPSWRLIVRPGHREKLQQGRTLRNLCAECHNELCALMGAPPTSVSELLPGGVVGVAQLFRGGPPLSAASSSWAGVADGNPDPPTFTSLLLRLQTSVRESISGLASGLARPVAVCTAVGEYLVRLASIWSTEVGKPGSMRAAGMGWRTSGPGGGGLSRHSAVQSSSLASLRSRGSMRAHISATPGAAHLTGVVPLGGSVWQLGAPRPEERWPALAAIRVLRCLVQHDEDCARWVLSRCGVAAEELDRVERKRKPCGRLRFLDQNNKEIISGVAGANSNKSAPPRLVESDDESCVDTGEGDANLLSALVSLRSFLWAAGETAELARISTLSAILEASPRGKLPSGLAALLAPEHLGEMLGSGSTPATRAASLRLVSTSAPRAAELSTLWGFFEESEGGCGDSDGVLEALLDCLHAPTAEEAGITVEEEADAETLTLLVSDEIPTAANDKADNPTSSTGDRDRSGVGETSDLSSSSRRRVFRAVVASTMARLGAEGGGGAGAGTFWGRLAVPRAALGLLASLLAGRQVGALSALLARGLAGQLAVLLDGSTRDPTHGLTDGMESAAGMLSSAPPPELNVASNGKASAAPSRPHSVLDSAANFGVSSEVLARTGLAAAEAGVGAEYLRLTHELLTLLRALLMEPSLAANVAEDLTSSIATLRLSLGSLNRLMDVEQTEEGRGRERGWSGPGLPLAGWAAALSRPYAAKRSNSSGDQPPATAVGAAATPSALLAGSRGASLVEVTRLAASVRRRMMEHQLW